MLKLREMRIKCGWTQRQLAIIAKISHPTICYLERDEKRNPSVRVSKKLAKAFGVDVGSLFPHLDEKEIGKHRGYAEYQCPAKVPCSWCGLPVCPGKMITVEVKGKPKRFGHARCFDEHTATKQFG